MVVAGEASGDQHAADVVAALQRARPDLRFFGMGGPRLAALGVELVHGAHEISVMGIVEVLPKLFRILSVMGDLARVAKARRPACALLVDAPDFNLRLAAKLKAAGVPVVMLVAPTVWAWREGRTRTLARVLDQLLCILPFEEKFLRERGVKATYVGSPVLDQVPAPAPAAAFRVKLGLDPSRPVLALLPGSRRGELARLLPTMVGVARAWASTHAGLQVVVPVAPGLPRALVEGPFAGSGLTPVLVEGRAPEVVGASDVALVASGTATLEAGLMQRPLVVIYKVAGLTYWIGRLLVKAPFFSLVNLLLGRRVVPELLQGEVTVPRVLAALEAVSAGPERAKLEAGLLELRGVLGPTGAAERAAQAVLALIAAC